MENRTERKLLNALINRYDYCQLSPTDGVLLFIELSFSVAFPSAEKATSVLVGRKILLFLPALK